MSTCSLKRKNAPNAVAASADSAAPPRRMLYWQRPRSVAALWERMCLDRGGGLLLRERTLRTHARRSNTCTHTETPPNTAHLRAQSSSRTSARSIAATRSHAFSRVDALVVLLLLACVWAAAVCVWAAALRRLSSAPRWINKLARCEAKRAPSKKTHHAPRLKEVVERRRKQVWRVVREPHVGERRGRRCDTGIVLILGSFATTSLCKCFFWR